MNHVLDALLADEARRKLPGGPGHKVLARFAAAKMPAKLPQPLTRQLRRQHARIGEKGRTLFSG